MKDKVIIVTGASKGVGFAIAESLLKGGAKVALFARNKTSLDEAVSGLVLSGINSDNILAVVADVSNKESVSNGFSVVTKHFGRLDGLVNNAGVARPSSIENLSADDMHLQINTNFIGLVYCCQQAVSYLKDNLEGGLIVNISSATVHHENEMSHLSVYAATKAAVEMFSRELRYEVTEYGIGVTVVVPGAVASEFGSDFDFDKLSVALHAWQDRGKHYDGMMQPETVGNAVAHCFTYPKGVSVDLLELKPHMPEKKPLF